MGDEVGDELVMRSVYLPVKLDATLRQLAHESGYTKSDLIRAAASLKAKEWAEANGPEKLKTDVTAGLRETSSQRQLRKVKPPSVVAAPAAEGATAPKQAAARAAPKQEASKSAPKRRARAARAEGTPEQKRQAG